MWRVHKFVYCYWISVHMTKDILPLFESQPIVHPFYLECNSNLYEQELRKYMFELNLITLTEFPFLGKNRWCSVFHFFYMVFCPIVFLDMDMWSIVDLFTINLLLFRTMLQVILSLYVYRTSTSVLKFICPLVLL